jgi:acyl carrier protein
MEIETEFGISIAEEELGSNAFRTIGGIIALIEGKMK